MDLGESDEDELPTHLDSPIDSRVADADPAPSFQLSDLTDWTVSHPEPLSPASPGTTRERGLAEISEKSPHLLPSTTPSKPPPTLSIPHRVTTEHHGSKPTPRSVAFKDIEMAAAVEMKTHTPASTLTPQKELGEDNSRATFVQSIAMYKKHLDDDFQEYENELRSRDRSQELSALDWDELEDRYQKEIGPKIADEQQIMEEFQARFNQFMLWMQISAGRESERAVKRLRTRVAFVQNSEDQLGQRQEHYGKVLAAFQNAMALLGNA